VQNIKHIDQFFRLFPTLNYLLNIEYSWPVFAGLLEVTKIVK